eukprot:jgi/Ulvmu1/7163/UM034_0071.1
MAERAMSAHACLEPRCSRMCAWKRLGTVAAAPCGTLAVVSVDVASVDIDHACCGVAAVLPQSRCRHPLPLLWPPADAGCRHVACAAQHGTSRGTALRCDHNSM